MFEPIEQYFEHIKPFTDLFPADKDHNISFNAFAASIAGTNNEILSNWHWLSQYWHCSPCLVNYHYINHLDDKETNYLLRTFDISHF